MTAKKINREIKLIPSDLLNRNPGKSFFQKIITRIRWSLHSNRNLVANLNSANRSYLLGWSMSLANIFACIGYILFFPKISVFWIYSTFLFAGMAFVLGFIIDTYLFWKKERKSLKKVLSILGLILSPISLYFARCIFVDITRLEPSNISRALITLSLITEGTLWLSVSIVVLLLIYCLTLFLQIMSVPFKLWILIPWIVIRNNPLYLFWLRKTKDPFIEQTIMKFWDGDTLCSGGRAIGAGLLSFILFSVFVCFPSMIKPYSLTHIAENIIVHADYRAGGKISECTNIEQSEWGYVTGYKKISIAHPEKGDATYVCLDV